MLPTRVDQDLEKGHRNSIGDEAAVELVARVESRVNEMEQKLSGLLAKNEEQTIRFVGLGFQTMSESNAWLKVTLRKHQSGLIVDVFMVFEHVYHAIEGIDTIATLEKLYEIKVLCTADSVAMTSFKAKTLKYFLRHYARDIEKQTPGIEQTSSIQDACRELHSQLSLCPFEALENPIWAYRLPHENNPFLSFATIHNWNM
jgi:hypothetical protein